MRTLTLILTLFLLGHLSLRGTSAHPVVAHKFYTSLAQVEYNSEEKIVEVTLRVFADDLELALKRRTGREVSLERTKEAGQLVLAYLRDTFEIRNRDDQTKALKWVGMELRADVVWLYFEAEMPEGLTGARLRDHVLFELFDEQVNTVSIRYPGARVDLVFVPGDADHTVPAPGN